MSTQSKLQNKEDPKPEPLLTIRPYKGKRPLMTCITCGKPGAVRYINKSSGQIIYEHRQEPPIKEEFYRGQKRYIFRRCSGGYVGQTIENVLEHGIQSKKQIMDDIARKKQQINDGKKNEKYRRKQQILCPRCHKIGSATIRGIQLIVDHYEGKKHFSHSMTTQKQKEEFRALIEPKQVQRVTPTPTPTPKRGPGRPKKVLSSYQKLQVENKELRKQLAEERKKRIESEKLIRSLEENIDDHWKKISKP
jgi:hypothetical protein